jgi:hypothetical protein
MKHFILLIIVVQFLISSCSITEKYVIGNYVSKYYRNSNFRINQDKTFDFIRLDPEINIPISELPNHYYFRTSGIWELDSNDIMILSSLNETFPLETTRVKLKAKSKDSLSTFVFLDLFGDTIPISNVYSDTSIIFQFQGAMKEYSENMSKIDSLKFFFVGYKPWIYKEESAVNFDFEIILYPEYRSDYFSKYKFGAKRNRLIDNINTKIKYKRVKNGIQQRV